MLETVMLWFSILFGATLGVAAGIVASCVIGLIGAVAIILVAAILRGFVSLFSKGG